MRDLRMRAIFSAIGQLQDRELEAHATGTVDLRTSELKVFSQNGEDGVIDALVRAIGVESKFFVEFGVEDGLNPTQRLLAEVFEWAGLFIEPHRPSSAACHPSPGKPRRSVHQRSRRSGEHQ